MLRIPFISNGHEAAAQYKAISTCEYFITVTTQHLRLPARSGPRDSEDQLFHPARRNNICRTLGPAFPARCFVFAAQQPDSPRHEMPEFQLSFAKSHPIHISRAIGQSPPNFVINHPVARILHNFGCHLFSDSMSFARPKLPRCLFTLPGVGSIVTWQIQIGNQASTRVAAVPRGLCRALIRDDPWHAHSLLQSLFQKIHWIAN